MLDHDENDADAASGDLDLAGSCIDPIKGFGSIGSTTQQVGTDGQKNLLVFNDNCTDIFRMS